jgi:hypothetical protein
VRLPLDHFVNYHAARARRAATASCGHGVRPGDTVGCNLLLTPAKTVCAGCWRRWAAEYPDAELSESHLPE